MASIRYESRVGRLCHHYLPHLPLRWQQARRIASQIQRAHSSTSDASNSELLERNLHINPNKHGARPTSGNCQKTESQGGMTRRLAQMAEESIEQSGGRAAEVTANGGFTQQLQQQLLNRIEEASFKNENAGALSQVNLPSGAGAGTRHIASSEPWRGNEPLPDGVLRMLEDAHRPSRYARPARSIEQVRIPVPLPSDLKTPRKMKQSQGHRLANARDRTSVYALSQDQTLSEAEREAMRATLKERFTSGARPMPNSVQGLATLANQRIEDAIGRGQFRNIARGKGVSVEKDHNANSPFLDTTEYFMNKMIQKQEIVPPWIEKQQELVAAVRVFRTRLRSDWKRHVARTISSHGGSLQEKMHKAELYAAAEKAMNETNTPRSENEHAYGPSCKRPSSSRVVTNNAHHHVGSQEGINASSPTDNLPAPFRDDEYLRTEKAYHTLSVKNLNDLTRTYNLMAPDLAKKPYYNLDRELRACFADVAPLVAEEIHQRATSPVITESSSGQSSQKTISVLNHIAGQKAYVHDDRRPQYGLRDLWRDLWNKGQVA